MNLVLFTVLAIGAAFVSVGAKPQVPYDYIPIGLESRDKELAGHPSDVVLNYERLFPARRKWIDHNFQFRRISEDNYN